MIRLLWLLLSHRDRRCLGSGSFRIRGHPGAGYAAFKYDATSDALTPVTLADKPPQGNDVKCGGHVPQPGGARRLRSTEYPRR